MYYHNDCWCLETYSPTRGERRGVIVVLRSRCRCVNNFTAYDNSNSERTLMRRRARDLDVPMVIKNNIQYQNGTQTSACAAAAAAHKKRAPRMHARVPRLAKTAFRKHRRGNVSI